MLCPCHARWQRLALLLHWADPSGCTCFLLLMFLSMSWVFGPGTQLYKSYKNPLQLWFFVPWLKAFPCDSRQLNFTPQLRFGEW